MIQKPTDNLNVIIYDSPEPPKYLKLDKKFFNLIIWMTPILILLLVSASIGYSFYFKRQLEIAKSSEPKIINDLTMENLQKDSAIEKLIKQNKTLIKKISAGVPNQKLPLSLFNLSIGLEDITEKKLAKLDSFTHEIKDNKFIFKFNLTSNMTSSDKLSGYIRVVQISSIGFFFYPSINIEHETSLLSYNKGESFTVSRFRPVVAEFNFDNQIKQAWYKIYLFNRSGDLIHHQEIGPYSVK